MIANKLDITSTLPCLGITLLKMGLVQIAKDNSIHVGIAKHATIMDFQITLKGKDFVEKLNIAEDIPI